jgi:hypothetical protein
MGAAAIPWIMTAVTVASTAVSVYSSVKEGKARENESRRLAEQSKAAAAREASDTRKQHQRIIATQKARYGASGLTMEGSPLLVEQESLKESKEQLARIMESGENQSILYEKAGSEAATSGYVGGIKSLLGGAETQYKIGSTYNWW